MVERAFLRFYPDSLTQRAPNTFPSYPRMAAQLARWVEWFPYSPAVRKVALHSAGLGARVPNVGWYLVCSTLGALQTDSSRSP